MTWTRYMKAVKKLCIDLLYIKIKTSRIAILAIYSYFNPFLSFLSIILSYQHFSENAF